MMGVVQAGPAAAAKGGNNDTANLCQQGGWQILVTRTGEVFKNQGDCVNDGAQGSGPYAGKAACAQAGGTFVLGGIGPTLYQCNDYPVSTSSDNALIDACIGQDGGLSFEIKGTLNPPSTSGQCVT
jgi:hypothetical protein